jgi:hypothetical protein
MARAMEASISLLIGSLWNHRCRNVHYAVPNLGATSQRTLNDLPRRELRQIFPRTCGVSPEGKREDSNDME